MNGTKVRNEIVELITSVAGRLHGVDTVDECDKLVDNIFNYVTSTILDRKKRLENIENIINECVNIQCLAQKHGANHSTLKEKCDYLSQDLLFKDMPADLKAAIFLISDGCFPVNLVNEINQEQALELISSFERKFNDVRYYMMPSLTISNIHRICQLISVEKINDLTAAEAKNLSYLSANVPELEDFRRKIDSSRHQSQAVLTNFDYYLNNQHLIRSDTIEELIKYSPKYAEYFKFAVTNEHRSRFSRVNSDMLKSPVKQSDETRMNSLKLSFLSVQKFDSPPSLAEFDQIVKSLKDVYKSNSSIAAFNRTIDNIKHVASKSENTKWPFHRYFLKECVYFLDLLRKIDLMGKEHVSDNLFDNDLFVFASYRSNLFQSNSCEMDFDKLRLALERCKINESVVGHVFYGLQVINEDKEQARRLLNTSPEMRSSITSAASDYSYIQEALFAACLDDAISLPRDDKVRVTRARI